MQHFGKSNRFGVPAPKPGAIPNFAKPGYMAYYTRWFLKKQSQFLLLRRGDRRGMMEKTKGWDCMGRTENVELTTLCLVRRGNEILLQNRVKKDWRGYALPGGHVEPGESIVDAVIREMKAETGLTVLLPRLCGVKQFPIDEGRYVVFLFVSDRFEGELTSSAEGRMEWVRRDRLGEYPCVADLEELISVMERDDLSEFLYLKEGESWLPVLK